MLLESMVIVRIAEGLGTGMAFQKGESVSRSGWEKLVVTEKSKVIAQIKFGIIFANILVFKFVKHK